jgi:hypothetical protein
MSPWSLLSGALAIGLVAVQPHADANGPRAIDSLNAIIGDESFVATFARAPNAGDPERMRIAAHLAHAERLLRAADVSGPGALLHARRQQNLDRLRAYIEAGVFPDAEDSLASGRLPTFIDDLGRRCAVAQLVEQSDGADAAAAIDRRFHHAYVADIHDLGFDAWVATSGFSREEIAIIQPTYSRRPADARWRGHVELDTRVGLPLMSSFAGTPLGGQEPVVGMNGGLRMTNAGKLKWAVAVDGGVARFPTGNLLYHGAGQLGAVPAWGGGDDVPRQHLALLAGAGVYGISGLTSPRLTLPFDAAWRIDLSTTWDSGWSLQLRGRGEVFTGRESGSVAWSGAADLVRYYRHGMYVNQNRYDIRLSAIVRELAGATYAGGELGFAFHSELRLVRRAPLPGERDWDD